MAMDIMKKRLGPYMYEYKAKKYQEAIEKYMRLLRAERVSCMKYGSDFHILARKNWGHRFFGITKEGIPIWTRKWSQYRYSGSEVCRSVLPERKDDICFNDTEAKTEETISFFRWAETTKKLAFVYLGIFWTLEEGETLNDAARRFIMAHQEVENAFRMDKKYGKHNGISEDVLYIYELFKDGALIFNKGKAILCDAEFFNKDISGLWAIMVADGFFEKEKIQEVSVGVPFEVWYGESGVESK